MRSARCGSGDPRPGRCQSRYLNRSFDRAAGPAAAGDSVRFSDRAAGVETENTSRTSLSIDLVSDKRRRGAVDVVALSLRGKGDERSVRFYCPSRSCQKHLPVQLAVNLAMLFDSAAPTTACVGVR